VTFTLWLVFRTAPVVVHVYWIYKVLWMERTKKPLYVEDFVS